MNSDTSPLPVSADTLAFQSALQMCTTGDFATGLRAMVNLIDRDQPFVKALFWLGNLYEQGRTTSPPIKRDLLQAENLFRECCLRTVVKNVELAKEAFVSWLRVRNQLSAEGIIGDAKNHYQIFQLLGHVLQLPEPICELNIPAAEHHLRIAMDLKHPEAYLVQGHIYRKSNSHDYNAAYSFYLRAYQTPSSDNPSIKAQAAYYIAMLLLKKRVSLYEKNTIDEQVPLSEEDMCMEEVKVPLTQNDLIKRIAAYFNEAAAAGIAKAHYRLGIIVENDSDDNKPDLQKAESHFVEALHLGYQKAEAALERIQSLQREAAAPSAKRMRTSP